MRRVSASVGGEDISRRPIPPARDELGGGLDGKLGGELGRELGRGCEIGNRGERGGELCKI